jgi:hypothetical protein
MPQQRNVRGASRRVTKLCDFSPIGRLFSFYSFWTITGVAKTFCPFFHGEMYALILTKNGLGHILGDFFTTSSGHSG